LAAATLSTLLPGLGQWFNGRPRAARRLLLPSLVVLGIVVILAQTQSPARLAAAAVAPAVLQALLVLNVLVLAFRLVAVGHAFFDRRYPPRPGAGAFAGLIVLVAVIAVPHGLVNASGLAAQSAFDRIFSAGTAGASPAEVPRSAERINVLIIGIDKTAARTATLTDTMMVASLDPVGRSLSLVSIPRDIVNVPLGNGNVFGPKLNSLMSYGDLHRDEFPAGGIRALQSAIAALLDVPIHYFALMDFNGFVEMVDAVGGVDVTVETAFNDALYDGLGLEGQGFGLDVGEHHLDGYEALAYARSRRAPGESDFTRAGRQQEIIVALRDRVTSSGASLVLQLPRFLGALGDLVVTDVPVDRLPELAAIADEVPDGSIERVVIRAPLVTSGGTHPRYGSILVADIPAIRRVAAGLMGPPGTPPVPWPTPSASPVPSGSSPEGS
jgi:LCP family protein required for cell wall assembly